MRFSALWSAFGLAAAVGIYAGCTQNFDQFDPTTGSGGSTSSSTSASTGGGGTGGTECQHAVDCMDKTCQTKGCSQSGQCTYTPVPSGGGCTKGDGTTDFCDDAGKCVDCAVDDNCTDPGACLAKHCDTATHTCKPKAANEGMSCGPDPLKCSGGVCKGCTVGAGDPPAGNCPPPTVGSCGSVTCQGDGSCKPGNADINTPCTANGGKFCDAGGNCKLCGNVDSQCGTNDECKTFSCVNNACSENDKGTTQTCTVGGKVCDGAGNCVGCNGKGDCPGNANESCNTTTHMCACTKNTCGALTCGPGIDDGCGGTIDCDNSTKDSNESDVDCGGAVAKCPTRCGQGEKCGAMTDCLASGSAPNCLDGVCCTTSTCATCTSCAGTGAAGTCSPVAIDQTDGGGCNNTNGCTGNMGCVCDGLSNCKVKNGGACPNGDGDCAHNHCAAMPSKICGLDTTSPCTSGSQCASGTCTMSKCT